MIIFMIEESNQNSFTNETSSNAILNFSTKDIQLKIKDRFIKQIHIQFFYSTNIFSIEPNLHFLC